MQNYDNRFQPTNSETFSPTKNCLRFDKLKQTLNGIDKIIEQSKYMIHNPYHDTYIHSNQNSHVNKTISLIPKQQHTQIDIKILSNYAGSKKTIHIQRPNNTTINLKINGQTVNPIQEPKRTSKYTSHYKEQFVQENNYQYQKKLTPSPQQAFLKARYQQKNDGTTKSFTPPHRLKQFLSPFVQQFEQNPIQLQQYQINQGENQEFPLLNNSKPIKKQLLQNNNISSRKNRQQIAYDETSDRNYYSVQHKQNENGGNSIKIQRNYPMFDQQYRSSQVKIMQHISYQQEQDQIIQQKKFDIKIQEFQGPNDVRKSNQQKKWNASRPVSSHSSQRANLRIASQASQFNQQRQKDFDNNLHQDEQEQQAENKYSQILTPVEQPLVYGKKIKKEQFNLSAAEKTSVLMHKYRGQDKFRKTYAKNSQRQNSYQSNKSLSPKYRQVTERLSKSKSKLPCPRFARQQHHDKLNDFRKKIKESYGFIQTYISQTQLDKIYKEMIEQDIPQHKWPQKAVDFVYKKVKKVYSH